MDRLLVARPGWLDWGWVLRMLDQEVRLPGEQIRPDDGLVVTPLVVADEPVAVTVGAAGSDLTVMPSAAGLREYVTWRFHLDLDESAVADALERAALPGVPQSDGWVRRPAAAGLWPYCLMFLCGGDPDARPVRRMFTDLGHGGDLLSGPEPGDLITAGDHRLNAYGIAPHRTANILGLARAFAARPDRFDEIALRALTAEQAIARLAELPHIGPGRARAICSTALGHDDVLPDLGRRDGELRRRLGLSWTQVRASAGRAAPYRSILGDTLLELLSS